MSLPITCHNAQFGTLGQIDPSHLAEIAKQGYKSVINNRPDGEEGPDQPSNASIAAEAERLGIMFIYQSFRAHLRQRKFKKWPVSSKPCLALSWHFAALVLALPICITSPCK
jgi:hypothetical protein